MEHSKGNNYWLSEIHLKERENLRLSKQLQIISFVYHLFK